MQKQLWRDKLEQMNNSKIRAFWIKYKKFVKAQRTHKSDVKKSNGVVTYSFHFGK